MSMDITSPTKTQKGKGASGIACRFSKEIDSFVYPDGHLTVAGGMAVSGAKSWGNGDSRKATHHLPRERPSLVNLEGMLAGLASTRRPRGRRARRRAPPRLIRARSASTAPAQRVR